MRKYKSLIIYFFIVVLFVGSLYIIGFVSPIRPNVDFVITYNEVPNLDYITGTGNYVEFIYPTMEGFINNQSQTSDPENGGKEPSGFDISIQKEDTTLDISKIQDSDLNEWTQFDWFMNETTNSELKDDITNFNKTAYYNVMLDDDLNNLYIDKSDNSVTPLNKIFINDYVFTVAESINTNENNDRWLITLPDTPNDPLNNTTGASFWSNGDIVEPEDFGFALEQQVRIKNAAASSYQITDYSNINGVQSCLDSQYLTNSNGDIMTDTSGSPVLKDSWFTSQCENLVISRQEFYDNYVETSSDKKEAYEKALLDGVGLIYDNNGYDTDKDGKNDTSGRTVEYLLDQPTPYFANLLINSSFYPVNLDWWVETFGDPYNDDDVESSSLYGSTEEYFISNGAFYVKEFDSAYQTYYEKNIYYPYKNIVAADDWIYRVAEEPATQSSLFNSGYSSFAKLEDAVSPSASAAAAENPTDYPYLQPTLSSPKTQYIFFNFSENSKTGNQKYIVNPNFRKAIQYGIDRTSYLNLEGRNNALPATLFSAGSMGSANLPIDSNGDGEIDSSETENQFVDFVDWANLINYNVTPDPNDGTVSLNPYIYNDRIASTTASLDELNKPYDPKEDDLNISRIDQQRSVDAAQYYWNEFKKDFPNDSYVQSANFDNKNTYIEIEYLSKDAQTDVLISALNEGLWSAEIPIEIKFNLDVSTVGTLFWSEYYAAENWDFMYLQWNPDYRDPLAFLKLLLTPDPTLQQNNSSSWTYLYGDQITLDVLGNNSYTQISESGLYSFVDKNGNATFKVEQYFGNINPTLFLGNSPKITEFKDDGSINRKGDGTPNTISLSGTNENMWTEILLNFENILSDQKSVPVDRDGIDSGKNPDALADQSEYYKGINSGDFWSLSNEERFLYYLVMEILIKDSAPFIALANETVSTYANRLVFMTTPPVGYENYTYAYDCREADKGMPDCDSLASVKKNMSGDWDK